MEIPLNDYSELAAEIESDRSPVGIDAKKTHVYILYMLKEIDRRLVRIESTLISDEEGRS